MTTEVVAEDLLQLLDGATGEDPPGGERVARRLVPAEARPFELKHRERLGEVDTGSVLVDLEPVPAERLDD